MLKISAAVTFQIFVVEVVWWLPWGVNRSLAEWKGSCDIEKETFVFINLFPNHEVLCASGFVFHLKSYFECSLFLFQREMIHLMDILHPIMRGYQNSSFFCLSLFTPINTRKHAGQPCFLRRRRHRVDTPGLNFPRNFLQHSERIPIWRTCLEE